MALRYVVKKRMIGFGKEKTEKYVAQNFITNTVNFKDLCDEISKVGMVPSGAVKFVLDALIDTLNINLNKGIPYNWVISVNSVPASAAKVRRRKRQWIPTRFVG